MNSSYPGQFYAFGVADEGGFLGFRGLAMEYDRTKADFESNMSHNETFVVFDDCYGGTVLFVSFDQALGSAGYDGEIDAVIAGAEADSLWLRMGPRQKTLLDAVDGLQMINYGNNDLMLHPNPAAEFISAGFNGNTLEFRAVAYQTELFIIREGDHPLSNQWNDIAQIVPEHGIHHYSSSVNTNKEWIRLVERELDGSEKILYTLPRNSTVGNIPRQRLSTMEEIEASLHRKEEDRRNGLTLRYWDPDRGQNKVLLALTIEAFAPSVESWFTSYWRNWWGYDAHTIIVPSDREYIQALIRAWHSTATSQGKDLLVHLVGDANDWEWWSDPARWPGEWQTVLQGYVVYDTYPAEGQPEHDIIPTWFLANTRKPGTNTGGAVPWIYGDTPYQDVNDDGIADIVVTRWPVTNIYQIAARADNMQFYNDIGTPFNNNARVHSWLAEFPVQGAGDTQRVLRIGEQFADIMSPGVVNELRQIEFPDPAQRLEQTVSRLNQGIDLLFMVASTSNRSYPANQLHNTGVYPSFNVDMLWGNTHKPYIMAFSCGTADFARTMPPDLPDPVCEQIGSAHGRGGIAQVGATGGTFQNNNQDIATQASHDLVDQSVGWPGPSMAERWLTTQRALGQEYQGEYGMMSTLNSYVFLGDPCSPLLQPDTIVDVAHTPMPTSLEHNYPNPFNPATTISFTLARACPVTLTITDVKGRKVKTIIDERYNAGVHQVIWEGVDDAGKNVASGVYLAKLAADGKIQTRKMVLVK